MKWSFDRLSIIFHNVCIFLICRGFSDVLVAVKSVGICGSDVHYWADGACGRFVVTDPIVMGHETSGTVVQVGSDVTNIQQGIYVAHIS